MQIWCTEVDISKKKFCAQFAVLTSDKLPVGLVTSCQCKYLHILHKLLITKNTSIYYISCFSHRKVGGKKNDQHIRALFKTTENIYIQSACIMKKSQVAIGLATNCIQVFRWTACKYITEYLSISEHQLKIKWEHLYTEYMYHMKNTDISPPLPHSAPSLLIWHLSVFLWE